MCKLTQTDRPSILVVDDEQIIADTLLEIMNGAGFRATAAYNGATALRIAVAVQPDYLLTDVAMPEMNGVQLAIAVKRQFPSTKIVLLSGHAGIMDVLLESRDRGYEFELISKPVDPKLLIDRLKALQGT